jgi:two-component system, sensor histidine kinase
MMLEPEELRSEADERPAPLPRASIFPHAAIQAVGMLTLMLVIVAGFSIVNLHERVEKRTKDNLAQLALVMSEETSRSFQAVDQVLKNAIDHLASDRSDRDAVRAVAASRAMHEYLVDRLVGFPQVDNLIVIDDKGDRVNHSRSWPAPATSLAHREQFRYLRDHDTPNLFVSEPVHNIVDGSWTLYLARRLNDSGGRFLGVVQAAVRLAYFESFYESVALGDGGAIALLRSDGTMLARYPFMEDAMGRVFAATKSGVKDAWGEGFDGIVRYVAFRAVPGFPLTISTAMTKEAVLGSWRQDAIILVLGSTVAVATIMLLLAMLLRKIRGMKVSEALLARQNEQLARSRKLLLDAQQIGKVGHWIGDDTGESTVWSLQLFKIAGSTPVLKVPLSTFLELIHPEDLDDYLRVRRRALAEGCPLIHEQRWVRSDGSICWVRIEGHLRPGPDGKVASSFGIIQDISERKIAEETAEISRLRLVDAIESLTKGFVLFDKDDRFVMSNTQFREMFPGWADLLKPGITHEELLRAAHERGLIDPKGRNFEAWLQRKMAWHHTGGKPIERQQSDGRWIQAIHHRTSEGGFVGLRTDITAFKKVQAELEQKLTDVQAIRQDLELQKQELVATSADLRSARDAAEAANRAKSDFLAIMSHEVRTPLSGMVGMVDLLRGTPLSEEQQRYTALAKESADLLLGVINDILDFSKLEAGRLSPECIDFDVKHLIEGVVSFLAAKSKDRKLELRSSLTPALPPYLKGDPNRVRQVLLNLVSNAIKFTDHGSVQINASHCDLEDGSVELCIEVVDSGIGMSAEVQKHIFDPFVQADTSISRKYGGSGLGLAICKQLCAMMGGGIGVESTPSTGSKFRFKVKCQPGRALIAMPAPTVAIIDRPFEILVAEDSPIIATLISSLLHKRGFRPTMVVNGAEAVAAVSRKSYDIVLMDIQMPQMDGISATQAIRNLPGPERDVPIVALTANALVGQRETYLAAGMNDYVTKPIQPALLFAAIDRWALKDTDAPTLAAAQEADMERVQQD